MINKDIDNGKAFDWGKASKDYAKYRDIYPDEFYQKIADMGLCVKGQRVLDLGTGTGVLPRNMSRFGAKFTGIDISENQVSEAVMMSEGMDIKYAAVSAENADFPAKSFDVITACMCFIYFDKDIILPKIYRMLADNGHFCILSMIWLPDEDAIARASEELVLKYNPSWTGAGFKRPEKEISDWAEPVLELFKHERTVSYDINIPFTRESWHGRMKACRGIGASSLPLETIEAFEQEHIQLLSEFPESFNILHHVTILDFIKKP